jgi:hypothetical protein
LLEVCGLGDLLDFLGARANIAHATRLAQCDKITIRILDACKMQVDGEAFEVLPETEIDFVFDRSVPFIQGPESPIDVIPATVPLGPQDSTESTQSDA